jgi:hypothetical protein
MTTNRLITAAWVIVWVIGFTLIAISWIRDVQGWVVLLGLGITAVVPFTGLRRRPKKPKG